jgi:hypothetical protein
LRPDGFLALQVGEEWAELLTPVAIHEVGILINADASRQIRVEICEESGRPSKDSVLRTANRFKRMAQLCQFSGLRPGIFPKLFASRFAFASGLIGQIFIPSLCRTAQRRRVIGSFARFVV